MEKAIRELNNSIRELIEFLKAQELRRHLERQARADVSRAERQELNHIARRLKSIHRKAIEIGDRDIIKALEAGPEWPVL